MPVVPLPRRRFYALLFRTAWWACGWTTLAAIVSAAPASRPPFRLGFSYSMFSDVNENDARASLRALSAIIARDSNIPANPDPLLFSGADEIAATFSDARVDAVAMPIDEYWLVSRTVPSRRFLFATHQRDATEEYLLLVPRDNAPKSLADLQGKVLSLYANPRARLGCIWIDVALAREGLAPFARHFQRIIPVPKPSKVVLDVFFHRADAGLVTRRAYLAMTELNPKVGQQLTVLAASPALVPALFAFRPGLEPEFEDHVFREFGQLDHSPAGMQALTIFQVGEVTEQPAAIFASAIELLDEYARLRPRESAEHRERLRHTQTDVLGLPKP